MRSSHLEALSHPGQGNERSLGQAQVHGNSEQGQWLSLSVVEFGGLSKTF